MPNCHHVTSLFRAALFACLTLGGLGHDALAGVTDGRDAWIGAQQIMLPVPAGYCPADRTDPGQGFLARQIEDMVQPHVLMLAFDIDCAAQARFKAAGGGAITPYVLFHAARDGDRIASYPGSRAAFIAEVAQALAAPEFRAELEATAKTIDSAMQEKFDSLADRLDGPMTVRGTQMQEPLGHDDNAVYLGFVSQVDGPSGPGYLAGVTGSTLINGIVVSVNLYGDYKDSSTFVTLLGQVRTMVDALVAANGA
jgi:hypothetical protein